MTAASAAKPPRRARSKPGARAWLVMAAAALAATFAGPTISLPQRTHDLMVVIDVTQSMDVQDVQLNGEAVSRLALAKTALAQALRRLPCGSKLGWGLFTEYRSFLLLEPVEVCENRRELLSTLAHIDEKMAWQGNSEIAKGLYGGLKIVKALPDKPALVFITDGQEAPPVNPNYRPSDEGAVRVAPGLVVGVGGPRPVPIPKLDEQGRQFGWWGADEVLQVDPRSLGRGGSVSNEAMSDGDAVKQGPMLGATPGNEHLSSLREPYLQLLAGETGLQYHRLVDADGLYEAITDPKLAQPASANVDLRWPVALLALLALVGIYTPTGWLGRRPWSAQNAGRASMAARKWHSLRP